MKKSTVADVFDSWVEVQNFVSPALVQVIAQVARFNWLTPYSIYEQGETRGTGFFIDDEGSIVTNAHVVDEATVVWIYSDVLGSQALFADIISVCPERDLALLRLRNQDCALLLKAAGKITHLSLGDSDQICSAESGLVLGYPLGQQGIKSTTGVVSGREYLLGRAFLQITAPVNPGSSGGPLINDKGQVIGIATAAALEAQNVGYALPINELKMLLPVMMQHFFVRKGSLGARFNHLTDVGALFLNNPLPAGLYINTVLQGSFFEHVGVHVGDMLYTFNGFRLDVFGDALVPWSSSKVGIQQLIARLNEGDELVLELYRDGKPLKITTTFEIMPVYPVRFLYPAYEAIEYEVVGGMVIVPLSLNTIEILLSDVPSLFMYTQEENRMQPMLIVTTVLPGSLAQLTYSVTPGCIITQINGEPVGTIAHLRTALHTSVKTDFVTMLMANNALVVLSLRQILADENRLSTDFVYPISATIKALMRQVENRAVQRS